MRFIRKSWAAVLIALLFGGIRAAWFIIYNHQLLLSEVVIQTGLSGISLNMGSIVTETIESFLVVFLFELYYGTLIYRVFCNVSIYYFSRQYNRSIWFIKKALELYGIAVLFVLAKVFTAAVITAAAGYLVIDTEGIILGLYTILIWSSWIYSMTLLVNLLAIKWTSLGGFTCVFGFQLFCMGSLIFFEDGAIFDLGKTFSKILFHLNPFTQICITFQKSQNEALQNRITETIWYARGIIDLNYSVVYCLVMAVFVTVIGCIIVNRFEFLNGNAETGGN